MRSVMSSASIVSMVLATRGRTLSWRTSRKNASYVATMYIMKEIWELSRPALLATATFATSIADEGSNNDSSPAGSGRSPLGPPM